MLATKETTIGLEVGCCPQFAGKLYMQLQHGYEHCSVLAVPTSVQQWRAGHRTARKRADRCDRLGYTFQTVRREEHSEDIYAVNTSLAERQGRPMSAGYRIRQNLSPVPEYRCDRHAIRNYGVFHGPHLYAYLWLYRAGDLALISTILGHGDHLTNDVMYLLFQGVVEAQSGTGGYFVYNRHDSGTDGLRYFKDKLGFAPTFVDWQP